MNKAHILFDFDGTLFSNALGIRRGWRIVLSELTGREVTMEEVIAKSYPDPHRFLSSFGLDPDDQKLKDFLSHRWPMIYSSPEFGETLFDGITELLEQLVNQGHFLYIWSAGYRHAIIKTLSHYKLSKFFLDIRAIEDGLSKPHPEGPLSMLPDVPKDKIIVIGDAEPDLLGAKNLDCAFIAALWRGTEYQQSLKDKGATLFASHPKECLPLISKILEKTS